jgi:hypothetical protein
MLVALDISLFNYVMEKGVVRGAMKEHRKHTRIPLQLTAEIRSSNGEIFKGGTKNISFGGTFLQIPNSAKLKQGEHCYFSIILQEEAERLSIDFNSEVIYIQRSGIGLRFISINGTDAYNHFKKLMAMNSPTPDKLLDELELHPGILLQDN